jgi:hypothetical protein
MILGGCFSYQGMMVGRREGGMLVRRRQGKGTALLPGDDGGREKRRERKCLPLWYVGEGFI